MDDQRCTGDTRVICWGALQRVAGCMSYLGLQSAARKRREVGQDVGAWAGSIVDTTENKVRIRTDQEKWDKTRCWIDKLNKWLEEGEPLNFKELERMRGFLIYVSRTYTAMTPYLKGLHQTIDSWRPFTREDGWKMSRREIDLFRNEGNGHPAEYESTEAPVTVIPAKRLKADARALKELTEFAIPPLKEVRCTNQSSVFLGGGDASGRGFGGILFLPDGAHFRYGQWKDHITHMSSNYRELLNLVELLEEAMMTGVLEGAEVFLFTDNTTAEYAFYKGNSSSETLFNLVLRLHKLQMKGNMILHVIHISGTRMQACGIDALSRGITNEGVMAGNHLLDYVPLNLDCTQRSGDIIPWIKSWWPETVCGRLKFCTPEDWFRGVREGGGYVWTPPPGAADAAVEELGKAIHKRPYTFHMMIIPRLLTSKWRKQLGKTTDLMFEIKAGSSLWGIDQHEPLICCLYFPLSSSFPWRHRNREDMAGLGRKLSVMWEDPDANAGALLCQLCQDAWRVRELPRCMVRDVLQSRETRRIPYSKNGGGGWY